jgi:hypothetical protein
MMFGALFSASLAMGDALADDVANRQQNLVKQANAPISSILQIRLQETYQPQNC